MASPFHLLEETLLFSEVLAGTIAIIKFKKFKDTHWKWFLYYLVFIASSELICKFVLCYFKDFRAYYYALFVIPLEFLIFYWLYSYKSLNKQKLFWFSCFICFISLFPFFSFGGKDLVNSFNYLIGTFLLTIMILLEYDKQIKSDDILRFKENMMFYINIGTGLFYVGTLPLYAFSSLITKDYSILYNYSIYFYLSDILMYILFSIALLWGKPNT